jgi:hypothetical protein
MIMEIQRDMTFLKKDKLFLELCKKFNFKFLISQNKSLTIYNDCFIIYFFENSIDGSGFDIYNYKAYKYTSPLGLVYFPKKIIWRKYKELIDNFDETNSYTMIFSFIVENFPELFDCENFEKYLKYFQDFSPEITIVKDWLLQIEKAKKREQNSNFIKGFINKLK